MKFKVKKTSKLDSNTFIYLEYRLKKALQKRLLTKNILLNIE